MQAWIYIENLQMAKLSSEVPACCNTNESDYPSA